MSYVLASSILCTIEVLDAIDGEKLNSVFFKTAEERAHVSFQEIMDGAQELKNTGNGCYKDGDYKGAIRR